MGEKENSERHRRHELGNTQGLFGARQGVCLATVGLIDGIDTVQACGTLWILLYLSHWKPHPVFSVGT